MSEAPEATFVLPLQEVAAHFASWNARSTEAEMGGSDNGNACLSIAMSTELGTGFLPFFREPGGKFLQQSVGFIAKETICRHHHEGGKCGCCSRQDFLLFCLWVAGTLLSGALEWFDLASTSTTRMSMMQSALLAQLPQIKVLPDLHCKCCKADIGTGCHQLLQAFLILSCNHGGSMVCRAPGRKGKRCWWQAP
jgi:hypothetical protein